MPEISEKCVSLNLAKESRVVLEKNKLYIAPAIGMQYGFQIMPGDSFQYMHKLWRSGADGVF